MGNWVCQTEVGISNLYRNVILIWVCHTYTGISNFTGLTYFCKLLSHFQESVKSRECQTFNFRHTSRKCQTCHTFQGMSIFKGMSHFQEIVQLSTSKGNSNFQGNISLQGNVTLSWEYQTF